MSNTRTSSEEQSPESPIPPSAFHYGPGTGGGARDAAPSRSSRHSEGYPSWLPRRPPPPAPSSTIGTSTPAPFDHDYFSNNDEDVDLDLDAELRHLDAQYVAASPSPEGEEDESPVAPNPLLLGGRKATPRSVRIVNLEPGITEEPRAPAAVAQQSGSRPTYATSYAHWNARAKRQNRVSSGSTAVAQPSNAMVAGAPRGWLRANAPTTMFNSVASSYFPAGADSVEARPRPRFNTRALHLELLRSPSLWMKLYYRLWPLLVLAHLPIQTFLDFNTAYMLIQVSKYPLPSAGPSSGKNWALGAAAYIACWFAWILVIFIVYELIYSFARRWRVRRPLIFPIYISNASYTYACMTSFNTFCFLQHLRWTAFVPISPELEGITSSSASTSPGSSREEVHEHAQEMVERGEQQHGRTDSTSSAGSAHEEDPALGPPRRHSAAATAAPPQSFFRKLTFASSTHNNRAVTAHRSKTNSMDIPKTAITTRKTTLRKRFRRAKRFWSQITWRDGLAETFNLYAQNVPNVVVLLPRAGLALALILGFAPGIGWSSSESLGSAAGRRDSTFFRSSDGLLTSYATGILWANVAWAAWRTVVLVLSWMGLWILSGHTCAGICGPRDKWEEEELNRLSASLARSRRQGYHFNHDDKHANEDDTNNVNTNTNNDTTTNGEINRNNQPKGGNVHKRFASWYSNSSSVDDDDDILPWEWRECTRARVQDAWEFCVVGDGGRLRWGAASEKTHPITSVLQRPRTPPPRPPRDPKRNSATATRDASDDGTGLDDAGLQRVLAAVGVPTPGVPTPARRGALRSDLFESPTKPSGGSRSGSPSALATAAAGAIMLGGGPARDDDDDDEKNMGERKSLPLLKLPYPFTRPGSGFVSSREGEEGLLVPFPAKEKSKGSSKGGSRTSGRSKSRSAKSGSGSGSGSSIQEAGEDEEHDEEAEEGEEHDHDEHHEASSSSHNYSSEPSTTSSPSSSAAPSIHSRAAGSNSLSSLGHPIPPTSPAFASRGYPHPHIRQLTQSGATGTSSVSHPHHRHSSIGSAITSVSGIGGVSSGFGGGGTSGNNPSPSGMSMSGRAGTRFPFLSGPPALSSPGSPVSHLSGGPGPAGGSGVGPSTHYGVHGRRVAQHHTGGTTTTGYSFSGGSGSGSGHGHGHSRGLSHASGFSGLSGGVGSDLGYAASGSGEGDVEELEAGVRDRASLSQSSEGSSASGGSGGGVIPMPPRHPHAGRARGATAPSSSASDSSRSSKQQGGVAFPTGSDVDATNTTAELGFVTGYAKGMGMEMLSIEASDSLARRERAGRMGPGVYAHQMYAEDDDDAEERPQGTEAPVHVQRSGQDQEEIAAAVAPHTHDNDHDDMYVQEGAREDDEDEEDEEAQREREDRVGLLSLSLSPSAASLHHHSPRASSVAVDQQGQLHPGSALPGLLSDVTSSKRSSRRNSATPRHSKESLSVAAAVAGAVGAAPNRSRQSSYVRSNRSSLVASASPTRTGRRDSLLGVAGAAGAAVRDRASSFGVRVRERAQSLLQSVVGGERRERTTSEAGEGGRHMRLGSSDASVLAIPAPAPAPTRVPAPIQRTVSGESSGSDRSKKIVRDYGGLNQTQLAEDEAYSSSSHSRSGSGSVVSGENYTFGRPIPFMAPRPEGDKESIQEEEEGEEPATHPEIEEVLREQVTQPTLPRVRTTSVAHSASSMGEELFYSPLTGATPLQSGLTTPVPTAHVPASFQAQQQSQEGEGTPELPWTQRLLQPPEQRWIGRDRSLSPSGDGSGSGEMMLSSAAESFVTAPVSLDAQSMFTITTRGGGDSSEAPTVTGSWDETRGSGFVGAFLSGTSAAAAAARGGRRGRERDGGLVERAGEHDAAGGLGDGRVV